MKCAKCGNEGLDKDDRFCSACGQELPGPERGSARACRRCPACGCEPEEFSRECQRCGILLNVPSKAAEKADDFVGRQTTLRRIDRWLSADPAEEPVLVLTGDAGTGKSALMAWLCGAGPATTDPELKAARKRVYESLDAIHFCNATTSGTSPSLDPSRFATNVSQQLSLRIPGYGAWLLANADRQTEIRVRQEAGSVSGTMIGVVVEYLGAKDPASVFSSVLEPLASIPLDRRQVVILVDALDEAELWPEPLTISELLAGAVDGVTQGVLRGLRFLVTTRPKAVVTNRFPPDSQWDLIRDSVQDASDVRTYIEGRFKRSTPQADTGLIQTFADASKGNFLYAKTALDYWLPRVDELQPKVTIHLPPTLDGIYSSFLQREYGSKDGQRLWKEESKPLLGALGVAQEKLGDAQLRFILSVGETDWLQDALERCDPYLEGERPHGPFGLYHQSFREFLFENDRFLLSAADANARTAARYLDEYREDWAKCFDEYGLQHTPTHLAEAARHSRQPRRHQLIEQLVSLVSNSGFRKAHEERLCHPGSLERDLERTLEEACLNDSPVALRQVFEASQELQVFRSEQMDPKRIFEAAEAGELSRAARRLEVFSADRHWHRASLLVAIWLAATKARDEARRFFARLNNDPLDVRPLPTLTDRVSNALSDEPADPHPTDLSPWNCPNLVRDILKHLRRAGGGAAIHSGKPLGFLDVPQGEWEKLPPGQAFHLKQKSQGRSYLGTNDGHKLVAFSLAEPARGDDALSEYIELLAANEFIGYRNRSLWELFAWILKHPRPEWVRPYSRRLCEAALAGSSIRFGEGVPIARRAIEKSRGESELSPGFDELLALTSKRAADLGPQAETGLFRLGDSWNQSGDAWGHHKRRLGGLAEALSVVIGDTEKASACLDLALRLPFSFPVYGSLAYLVLAESALIVGRGAIQPALRRALQLAGEWAHCARGPLLCARMTSRYNALFYRFQADFQSPMQGSDLAEKVTRFTENPSTGEFSATHAIGESYCFRTLSGLQNPEEEIWRFSKAATLQELARVYALPLVDLLRLNKERDWRPDEVLREHTQVRLPDQAMSPLLATYFSSLITVNPDLDSATRMRLIQLLVPRATGDPAALDTVLSRLLMAARPDDLGLFMRLPQKYEGFKDWKGFVWREALPNEVVAS